MIPEPEASKIDCSGVRNHVAFGFGIHLFGGNRFAEMQLRVVWEKALKRFRDIRTFEPLTRPCHIFVRGFSHLPVQVARYERRLRSLFLVVI